MEQETGDINNTFQQCWEELNSDTPQLARERLKRLSHTQRLEVLQKRKTAGDPMFAFDKINLLHMSIKAMNADCKNYLPDKDNLLLSLLELVESEDQLRMLLAQTGTDCNTALAIASMYGDTTTARCILDTVAESDRITLLTAKNWLMETPLHHAAEWGNEALVLCMLGYFSLLDQLALISMKTEEGDCRTVLHCSIYNSEDDFIILSLLQYMSEAEGSTHEVEAAVERILLSPDKDGNTFLHCAAEAGSDQKVIKIVSEGLSSTQFIRVMQATNHEGMTPLHYAGKNRLKDDSVLLALLQELKKSIGKYTREVREIMLQQDDRGETVLHKAAQLGTLEQVRQITTFPRKLIKKLSESTDIEGRVPRDVATEQLKADYIDQIGAMVVEFYHLETPPKVLVFYSTKDRDTHFVSSVETDAETEKSCIVQHFEKRGIDCVVKRDPTREVILTTIEEAKQGHNVSGLVVFCMSHGLKGIVQVAGPDQDDFMYVNDLIHEMHVNFEDKPKVLFLQACQSQWANSSSDTQQRPTDPLANGGRKYEAIREGIQLDYDHFLLFQASVSGTEAVRCLMIPELIDSVAELEPHECIEDAVKDTKLKLLNQAPEQIPKLVSTLRKKFCIAKNFQDCGRPSH